jgi:Arc/MetJ-type ribon-helix-helix transcriptional regulator
MQLITKTKDAYLPPIRVEAGILEELDALVEKFGYRSRTEVIREAIEEKIASLRGTKIMELREITDGEAKKELLEFIKGKESIYPSDIADALRLPLEQVFRIVNHLFGENKVEEA